MKKMIQKIALAALVFSVPATIFAGELAYKAMEGVPVSKYSVEQSFKAIHVQSRSRELLAIFHAIRDKKEDVVLDLIETFPSVVNEVYTDLDDNTERTIFLRELATNASPKIIDACIVAGADVHKKYSFGNAISCAIQSGNAELVQAVLSAGVDANTPLDENGKTPLMLAAERAQVGAVNALLAAGANHEAKTKDGQTALDFTAYAPIQLRLIREKKSHTVSDVQTLLRIATDESKNLIQKILTEEEIVPDEACVYIAMAQKPSPKKVEMLLNAGAKPPAAVYDGLHKFRDRGAYYRAFLKAGIRPNEKIAGEIFRARNVETDTILALLKTGAKPTERDLQQLLHSNERAKILEACFEGGLDPNVKLAKKPLIMAVLDDMACVKLLVERGADVDFMVDARHSFRDFLERRKPDVLKYINSVKPAPEKPEGEQDAGTPNRNRRERAERPSRERGDRRGNARRGRDAEEKDDVKADDAENAEAESAGTEESAENEKSESAEKSVPEKSAETENSSSSKAYNVR